jgi:hypothetical protein
MECMNWTNAIEINPGDFVKSQGKSGQETGKWASQQQLR